MISILGIFDLAPPFGLVPATVARPPLIFVPNYGETIYPEPDWGAVMTYPAPDWSDVIEFPGPDWSDEIRYPER